MKKETYTIVTYNKNDGHTAFAVGALKGIRTLRDIIQAVEKAGGLPDFTFTRYYESGFEQHFQYKDGELTEVTPKGKKSSNITLQH